VDQRSQDIAALKKDWAENPRWKGITRNYRAEDVVRLRGSLQVEHTLAKRGAEKLWAQVNGAAKKGYVNSMGALTGGQAMQQAKAGIEAIYLSGWQVAADGNTSETMYPDQSLYAYDSVPTMVRRINNSFRRADEIQWSRGINPGDDNYVDYFLPIVADAEAGFGGVLNAFELMKNMITAGAGGVHFEDQLAAGCVARKSTQVVVDAANLRQLFLRCAGANVAPVSSHEGIDLLVCVQSNLPQLVGRDLFGVVLAGVDFLQEGQRRCGATE